MRLLKASPAETCLRIRSGVSGLRVGGVSCSLVFGVLSDTFVLNVGQVSVVVSFVGDDLNAAVGEQGAVDSGAGLSVAGRVVGVVVVVIIFDSVTESERHRWTL